jgi:NTP pyrophosphatase (non-canonical NTP hydrolase)
MGELAILQSQQVDWVKHNFGDRPSWMPLLGIIEELGELDKAIDDMSDHGIADAIADTMIYMADFATAMGWSLQLDVFDRRCKVGRFSFIYWAGKLAHAHLKGAQNIRVTEAHKSNALEAVRAIVWMLERIAARYEYDVESVTWQVWQEVKKRDWKAYPETGLPTGGA